jgi:PhnB protein
MMKENIITTLHPFLTVKNAEAAVSFYIAALGAIEMKRHGKPGEKIMAKISIEGAEFWVGDEEPQCDHFSPDLTSKSSSIRIILETMRADEIFEAAIKLGATQICPMTTEAFWRIGKLKDPFGHVWEIGYVLNK